MNILLDIAIGVAAGLAAFVLASVLLLHKLTRLFEVNDARDRDLMQASLHRFHKEHSK